MGTWSRINSLKAIEKFNKDNSDKFEVLDFCKFKVGEGIEIKKLILARKLNP